LGGKNAMIVLDDVDPVAAASDAAYACFSSSGQLCVSIERVYVQRGAAEAFTAAFAQRVGSLTLGSAFDYSTDVGSLTSAAQLARVQAHLDDAVAKGATVVTGGAHRPDLGPYFFEPTVLTGVTQEMACAAGETFGPLVSVYTVDTEEEAVIAVNDSEYGLNASVLSRSNARAQRVAAAIDAGSVNINEGYRGSFSTVDAPMGGVKNSGLGRRNGPEGLLRFVEPVTVARPTGLLQLPRTGKEFGPMVAPMLLLSRVLKAARLR
ncbi:MAG: aldehyde dehydrogenase family protein, partial [Leifsonia sp.]